MAKFILDGQEYGGGSGSRIVKLTQAEYDALPNDKLSDDIIYLIKDSGELTAENLFYDGSVTGLGNNVQDAVDNLDKKVSEQNKNLSDVNALAKSLYDNKEISLIGTITHDSSYAYFGLPLSCTPKKITVIECAAPNISFLNPTVDVFSDGILIVETNVTDEQYANSVATITIKMVF